MLLCALYPSISIVWMNDFHLFCADYIRLRCKIMVLLLDGNSEQVGHFSNLKMLSIWKKFHRSNYRFLSLREHLLLSYHLIRQVSWTKYIKSLQRLGEYFIRKLIQVYVGQEMISLSKNVFQCCGSGFDCFRPEIRTRTCRTKYWQQIWH